MGFFSNIVDNLFKNSTEQVNETSNLSDEASEIVDDASEISGWYTLNSLMQRYNDNQDGYQSNLFRVGIVYACINYRARMLAKLPFQVFHKEISVTNGEEREQRYRADISNNMRYLLERRPNKYQSPYSYKMFIMTQLLSRGYAVIYKKYDIAGNIIELIPWKSNEVAIEKVYGEDEYLYSYKGKMYTEDEVIYIPYISTDGKRGVSPLSIARRNIMSVEQMDKHLQRFYKDGAFKQGALKMTQPLSIEAKRKIKQEWNELYGNNSTTGNLAVLDNGIDFVDISLPMNDLQFVESKQLSAREIAAIFDVPPSVLGLTQEKYSNLQEINDRFIQDVVAPDCINIEEAHNFSCFMKNEVNYYTKFNLAAGMRGSNEKRMAYYEKLLSTGVATINEVRAWEDMNDIGELGDKHYSSLNYTTLETLEKHERIREDE